jgi:hypothetical protein
MNCVVVTPKVDMNAHPCSTALALPPETTRAPWILSLRPATLAMLATLAVALISAAALLQPHAAQAETARAIVSAVIGA